MPKKNRISRAELLGELEQKLAGSDAPKLNKDLERLSLQSAVFLVGNPKKPAESDMLDREQAEKLAGEITRKSDPNYMEWNYGNLHDTAAEKHFEGMLLQSIDSLSLPPEVDRAGKKEELRSRIESRGPTYGEYLLLNTVRTPGAGEYREPRADAESQVPEKTGKVFTALTHCMSRNAGLPALRGEAFEREARVYCGMPICRLTLRDKRTAEMLEHREFGNVAVALKSTQDSFQFADKESFRAAQKDMTKLLSKMSEQKYEGEQAKKWHALKQVARSFAGARFHVNDVDAVVSAKLFLTAESFLSGQKGGPEDPGTKLALSALGIGVPDAPRNPDVKALVGTLNARQGPDAERFSVPDREAPSMSSQKRTEPRQAQTETPAVVRRLQPELTL